MNDKKYSSRSSATNIFFGIASITAGVYHGYMDGQGVPIQKENLEEVLSYAPALIRGGIGAIFLGIDGLVIGRRELGATGAVIGTALGTGLGGAVGGIKGGLHTLLGYGMGYVAGSVMK